MKYIAAYLLAVASGKPTPTEDDVTKILKAADVTIDNDTLKKVMDSIGSRNAEELINEGKSSLSGIGGGAAAPSSASGAAAAPAKEEKKEEPEESAPLDLADMFGDF